MPVWRRKAILEGHIGPVYALSEGHAEAMIISGGSDRHILSWNLATGNRETLSFSLPAKVYSMGYHQAEGLYYFGNGMGQVHVVDHASKKEIKCLQLHEGAMFSMLILQNRVITGAEDGSVHLLSSDGSGKRVETGSKCKIRMIRASSTADQFWVCTGAGELLLMDVEGKIIMRRMVHQESCNAVIELNQDYVLSGGKDAHIQVISRQTLETESRIPAHNWAVYDFARSPDGTYLASGSRDKTVKIWRASDLSFVQRLSKENAEGHHYSVNRLLWDPASGILCSAGDDRNLYLWQQD